MRTTLALDDALVSKAQALTELTEKPALGREALKVLIERESAHRLVLLGCSETALKPISRRQFGAGLIKCAMTSHTGSELP